MGKQESVELRDYPKSQSPAWIIKTEYNRANEPRYVHNQTHSQYTYNDNNRAYSEFDDEMDIEDEDDDELDSAEMDLSMMPQGSVAHNYHHQQSQMRYNNHAYN